MKLACIMFLGFVQVGCATTYYVSTTNGAASDANPGTSGAPWKTISHSSTNVSAGDLVIIKAGTYTGEPDIIPSASGSAGNPITFTGERGSDGSWLTILDHSIDLNAGWVAAGEIGSGVYKQTGLPFTTSELTIGNKRVFFAKTTGDISADIADAYSDGPTTGAGFLTLASAATITTKFNSNQSVTWWDGIEALWVPSGTTTYLRLRDGSDPNGKSVRAVGSSTGFYINDKSYIVVSNMLIRGATWQVTVSGANANHNIIQSNYLSTGFERVLLSTDCSNNRIINNSITTDFYGYSNPGAWARIANFDSVSGIRLNQYLVCKYMMGNATSYDQGVDVAHAGGTNIISGNVVFKCLGVGIGVSAAIGTYANIITNTIISGNNIYNCSSIGIMLSDGETYTQVYSNTMSDSDCNIRFHHLGVGGETNRVGYVFRNTGELASGVGQQLFFHFTNPNPSTYIAQFWVYQNSFSGGIGTMLDNGYGFGKGGLTNFTFLNNIMSGAYFFYAEDTAWTNASYMGLFDYNLTTPPCINYPAGVCLPSWYAAHNVDSTTNQWTVTQGVNFSIPSQSQAVDSGANIPVTYPSLPWGAIAKTGPSWDMGAFEYSPLHPLNLNVGTATFY